MREKDHEPGSFLVSPSEDNPENYVLSVLFPGGKVEQILIIGKDDGFILAKQKSPNFSSILELVGHYHLNPLNEADDSGPSIHSLKLHQSVDSVTSFFPTDIEEYYQEITTDNRLTSEFDLIKVYLLAL